MLGKTFDRTRSGLLRALAIVATGLVGYAAGTQAEAPAPLAPPPLAPLFVTDKTVMGEPIVYPTGAPAELTASIMVIPPGGTTPWHVHNVPLAGIVLEGEITFEYRGKGTRTFKTGEAIAEAMQVAHRGTNPYDKPVRIFVLYMGAKGVPTTTRVEQ